MGKSAGSEVIGALDQHDPLARAIDQVAASKGAATLAVSDFRNVPGHGAKAQFKPPDRRLVHRDATFST